MTGSPSPSTLSPSQRFLLLFTALGLAVVLFLLRGGLNAEAPLEQLARRSLDPDTALSNGRPTMIEFYADWCQACREMAPALLSMERETVNQLDVVLINVDNPRWQDLTEEYKVNGIPQLNFFDAKGDPKGLSVGVRSHEQLQQLTNALIQDQPLPKFAGVGAISSLPDSTLKANNPDTVGPRNHS
ncbi:MAG: thioredoxin domain-containing protein [Prochlorococcus sp.]